MIFLTFFRLVLKMIYIDFLSIFELLKFWVFMHFLCCNLSFSPVLTQHDNQSDSAKTAINLASVPKHILDNRWCLASKELGVNSLSFAPSVQTFSYGREISPPSLKKKACSHQKEKKTDTGTGTRSWDIPKSNIILILLSFPKVMFPDSGAAYPPSHVLLIALIIMPKSELIVKFWNTSE